MDYIRICHQKIIYFFLFCSKQIIKIAKKTITEKIRGRSRQHEQDKEDAQYELSRCNSEDFDTQGMTRDSDTVYFKEKHLVSVEIVHTGLVRFSLMMDMTAPGTVPDPLLIAALIDLVSNKPAFTRS